jgi:hypothetical protein
MPVVLGEYTPPPAAGAGKPPCCSACADPERRRRRRAGAQLVTALARSSGARSSPVRGLGAGEDPLIWWPGDIKALIDRTDTEVSAVDRDYEIAIAQGRITATTWANFGDFRNEWRAWLSDLSWYQRISGGTVATVQGYRARLDKFREILKNAGAMVQSAPLTNLPPKGPATDWGNVAKWVAGGAIVLGGALAIGHITRLVPKLGS